MRSSVHLPGRTVDTLDQALRLLAEAAYEKKRAAQFFYKYQKLNSFLASALKLPEIVQALVHGVREFVSADATFVALTNPSASHLETVGGIGFSEGLAPIQRFLANDWVRRAFVMEVLDKESSSAREWTSQFFKLEFRAAAFFPLFVDEKLLGLIGVGFKGSRSFLQDERDCIASVITQCAWAVERGRLFQQFQEAIQMRDEFVSIASHELKTPITSLKMQLQLAKKCFSDPQFALRSTPGFSIAPEKAVRALDISSTQVDRLTRLIEDLLDVSRIQAGQLNFHLEEVDLSMLTHEVIDRYADELAAVGCPLELKIQKGIFSVIDRNRLEQVLINLISNAIKYASGKPIQIQVYREGCFACLVFQDQGPGIPRERQARIFERFERAVSNRYVGGLGLGLFIARQIVQAHKGTIQVESELGKGARFKVTLPLDPALTNSSLSM